MRTLIALLTMLALPAMADKTPERWVKMSGVDNADVREAQKAAAIEVKRITDALKTKVCSNRKKYEDDPTALADALQARVDGINATYRAELAKLDAKLLEKGEKANVDAAIASAPISIQDTVDEQIQRVRTGETPAAPLVAIVCQNYEVKK